MIVVVAPYTGIGKDVDLHLGASRKIELILGLLVRLDSHVVLINSAHLGSKSATINVERVSISGFELTLITPPVLGNSKLGKFQNLFCVDEVMKILATLGTPKLFWFYNGFAFEMLVAMHAKKFNVPMILEFEDWHFARRRGINPKGFIDFFFWYRAAHLMTSAFVVNAFLAEKMSSFTNQVEVLPGIVPEDLTQIARASPFPHGRQAIKVGYFGGLSVEKGADIVLRVAQSLPDGYEFHVTGSGPLADEFKRISLIHPARLHYHGRVGDAELYKLIAECDVILNPHSSLDNMCNGVFPFKVIEAVASGRLLISTALPKGDLADVLGGICFVDGHDDSFRAAILQSHRYYVENLKLIQWGAHVANQRFGQSALLGKLKLMLKLPLELHIEI
ncbi:MAG: glycosyltransferase [Sideroxyarcus sp.]|nr:glycosyltransferase [Sideroxyarcus sp.]